jgi:hypothetical protein
LNDVQQRGKILNSPAHQKKSQVLKSLDSPLSNPPPALSPRSAKQPQRSFKVSSRSVGGIFSNKNSNMKSSSPASSIDKSGNRNVKGHAVDREMTIARMQVKDTDQCAPSTNTVALKEALDFISKRKENNEKDKNDEATACKKKPIRMKIPLEDYTDYVEDGVDARKNKSMSVNEALKKINCSSTPVDKSKQWGIDMSRFKDD